MFFTERGYKPYANQLGQPWPGTLVSLQGERTLAAQKEEEEAQMRRDRGGKELWGDRGHSLLPWKESIHHHIYIYIRVDQVEQVGTDTGTRLGQDSWLARRSEVTDPKTPDLLREAGRQSKARHNFLTLLAHNRLNTGWHTVLNRIDTKQDRVHPLWCKW